MVGQVDSPRETEPTVTIGKEIGNGGTGIVYRGWWQDNQGVFAVALKKAKKSEDSKQFQEEVARLRELKLHNMFIVQFYGTKSIENIEYIVMEICHGTLSEYFTNKNTNTEKKIEEKVRERKKEKQVDGRSILGQLVVGLSYLHGKNVIHKDLKPENILWQKSADCTIWKLSDFGFARRKTQDAAANASDFNNTEHLGTRGYIAPEVWKSGTPSFASDVWALGAVAFFVVSHGKHPYDIKSLDKYMQIRRQRLIAYLKTAPGLRAISDDWRASDLIFRMLHNEAERRPSIFLIPYHPFFSLQNEKTKRFLATKIFNFALYHDDENKSRLRQNLKKEKLLRWHKNFKCDLIIEIDPAEIDQIIKQLKEVDFEKSKIKVQDTNAIEKVNEEISSELDHSAQLKTISPSIPSSPIVPNYDDSMFNGILNLFECGPKLFPLYLFHVLNSISPLYRPKDEYNNYFQVYSIEYCLAFLPFNEFLGFWEHEIVPGTEMTQYMLKIAVLVGLPELVPFLIEKGASVKWRDKCGEQIIHYAAWLSPSLEIIEILIKNHADVKSKTILFQTPLHYASARNANIQVIKLLIDHNADLHARDSSGQKPFSLAEDNPNPRVLQILRSPREAPKKDVCPCLIQLVKVCFVTCCVMMMTLFLFLDNEYGAYLMNDTHLDSFVLLSCSSVIYYIVWFVYKFNPFLFYCLLPFFLSLLLFTLSVYSFDASMFTGAERIHAL